MQNSKFRLSYILVIILLGLAVVGLGFTSYNKKVPKDVYKVYVDGEIIGTVLDKNSFDNYINDKEEDIKTKYGVDKVYMPNGVTIKKVTTYETDVDSNEEVYRKIVKLKQFTIKGTIIKITKSDDTDYGTKYIYTLNKEIFDEAVVLLIKSFVDDDDYEKYMTSSQVAIVETGSIINDIDISQDITYKTGYISIDNEIYTKADELAKYLLYGTTDKQATYIVHEGDTIEEVAVANKLNVQEFLLANSQFNSETTLLYAGQEVNVGLINPVIDIVVEINGVNVEKKAYDVKIQYDDTKLQGTEYVAQDGEDGLYRVSREYQYINGQLASTQTLNSTELKPAIDKVIVKGDKEVPYVADLSYWAWPTETPYTITTYYGYRWGSMHAAIDISGPGYGSDIYAANNGTVIAASSGCVAGNYSCNGRRGNYVVINHNNGNYYSTYMHMSLVNVKVGQVVARGQKIGTMGNTGEVYPTPSRSNPYAGTHLHFAVSRGNPLSGGSPFNPLSLY